MYVGKLLGILSHVGKIYALSLCRSPARPLYVISRIIELFRQSYLSPVFDVYFYLREEYSLTLQRLSFGTAHVWQGCDCGQGCRTNRMQVGVVPRWCCAHEVEADGEGNVAGTTYRDALTQNRINYALAAPVPRFLLRAPEQPEQLAWLQSGKHSSRPILATTQK